MTIHIGDYWTVIIFFELDQMNIDEVLELLHKVGCSNKDLAYIENLVSELNTGFTYSNSDKLLSVVGISKGSSGGEVLDTVMHELDHVQMTICNYYGIIKDSEAAAYLMGYIAKRVYTSLTKILR